VTSSQGQETLDLVVDAHATVGEGPVWDASRGILWWVDIPAGLVHRFDPRTGSDRALPVRSAVGAVALRRDGTLLVALADELAAMDPDTGRMESLVRFAPDDGRRIRCNDGKCDPAGRFWIGRMAPDGAAGEGSLLRVDPDLTMVTRMTGLAIPNGLGWSLDGRSMYFLDSSWCEVRGHSYDPATGEMGEGAPLVRFLDDGTVPDGLTIDAEGHLWVARWGGGRVVRVDPGGNVVGSIDLPVSQATSCTFGGDDLGDLYITTAHEDFEPGDFAREPLAGGLFRCRPGVRGLPPIAFAG
jgi:sugar lactone lactonase YvrE